YLNQYLSGFDQMVSAMARHPAVLGLDRDRCDELFASILVEQPLLLNIVLTDPNGVLKGTGVEARASLGPVVSMRYVQDVVKSGRPVVSELTTGQVSGKPTIILGYPIVGADRAVIGVLGLGVNLARLQSVFSSIP